MSKVVNMSKEKRFVNWNIPVTRELDTRVEDAVGSDTHISKSELVRDAVRRLLKEQDGVL